MSRRLHPDTVPALLRDAGCLLIVGLVAVLLIVAGIRLLEKKLEPPEAADLEIVIEKPDGLPLTPAAATTSSSGGLELAAVLEICRATYFTDPPKGRALFAKLAAEDRRIAAALCLSYRQGALDMAASLNVTAEEQSE